MGPGAIRAGAFVLLQQRLRAERLRGVTETVGALNHEVNNPLATIVGTSQLLLRRDDLEEATRPRVDRILEAAQRIQSVTSRMASIIQATSRPYPGQDTRLDVRGSLARLDAVSSAPVIQYKLACEEDETAA